MTKIIQFPRPNPNRRWSPTEILTIEEEPGDRLRQRQERSKLAVVAAIESSAGKRESRKVERKQYLLSIISDGQQWTVARLIRLIEYHFRQPISRATVVAPLKELKAEGKASNCNQFWKSTTEVK